MDRSDPRHERLCAYVFGELEGEARTAFEAELEASPELQAERANLEATIGLVQSALPADRLPESVHADLERAAAAQGGRRGLRFLPGNPLARMAAAAAAVLVTGATAFFLLDDGLAPHAGIDRLASSSPAPGTAPEESEASLRGLGYISGDEASNEAPPMEDLRALAYGGATGAKLEGKTLVGGSTSDTRARSQGALPEVQMEAVRRVEDLGYGGGALGQPAATPPASAAEPRGAPGRAGDKFGGRFGASAEEGKRLDFDSASSQKEVLAGEPSLGELLKAETTHIGLERKRAASGPGSPGPSGPSSPGPAAPGSAGLTPLALDSPAPEPPPVQVDPFLSLVQSSVGLDEEESAEDGDARRELRLERQSRPPGPRRIAALGDELIVRCGLRPDETPREMFFRQWGDHPFVLTQVDPLSTFSVDVDTASYTLTRRHLASGRLPDPARVRTEEFVNYFRADRPAPPAGETFAIGLEAAPSPFAGEPGLELLRVTLRGEDVHPLDRQPLALTFVVDVSGSMKENGSLAGESRLDLVKHSLELLIRQLSGTDSLALVTFNKNARVVAPPTPAGARGVIEDALAQLKANGSTSVQAGLTEGFRLAAENLVPRAVNRVVFLSDGVGNIGETDQAKILEQVAAYREQGVYLNAIGLGFENHDSDFLEELADRGDGVCSYVDSRAEAEKAFVNDFTKTLQPIARDVKIQVEFDPTQVRRYRQLGYENRALAHADFRNDAVDAGEVNAGHQISALYEVERHPGAQGVLATVRVRYKGQHAVDAGSEGPSARRWAETAVEIERSFSAAAIAPSFASASPGYRRSVLVAQFAEVLRRSVHARGDSWETLVRTAKTLDPVLDEPEFTEFVQLLEQAEPRVQEREAQETPEILQCMDVLSRLNYERAQRELVEKDEDPERLAREAEAIEAAESALREAVRRAYAAPEKTGVVR